MTNNILKDLGDNLILRRSSPADADALADFNSRVHSDDGWEQPENHLEDWTRDLLTKPHPTFSPDDFTIVEDTQTGKIVSTSNLISQTWSYAGVEFGVGRPELVGTHPDYRNRGLIREQFEVLHQWSAERGEKVQVITGIPWYYRLFGYEMTVDLDGGRSGSPHLAPKLKDDEEEPFKVRPADESDLEFIAETYEHGLVRQLLGVSRDAAMWKYELNGRSMGSTSHYELSVIENADGESVGFLVHPPAIWGSALRVIAYELRPGMSWLAVTPSVLRYLKATGEEIAAKDDKQKFNAYRFVFGRWHPVYDAARHYLLEKQPPYAWYIRVADIPDFLQHISPVLEERLADSIAVGYTGELKLNFYRDGVKLDFEKGKIKAVEPWKPVDRSYSAAFPDKTFLHLLFGHRTFEELEYAYTDCFTRSNAPDARPLLEILFPPEYSHPWGIA
ncbi:MAG: GNAT family N-acetyltransferase [Chloroflexi bacterium]|nr:MAG: GNAT family N-acetyltransferase [Chloroflexota bacterium]MBL1195255.1 GNAT family N-acetyltransferase [Chloroflexota bacterium]NOH12541.1 GNAT family N-acetyltransferase [Chloroflexota bacterium]